MTDGNPMLAHLKTFCASEGAGRYGLAQPFTSIVKGEPLTIATNGHLLLVVPGDHGYPAEDAGKKIGAHVEPVLLGVKTEPPVRLDLTAVRHFLGMLPVPCTECVDTGLVDCPECDGEGETECVCDCGHEHESRCDICKGRGEVACSDCRPNGRVTRVRLCGRLFSRENITTALQHLPGNTVEFHRGSPALASVLSGSWGRILIMPIRDDDGSFSDVPNFGRAEAVHASA